MDTARKSDARTVQQVAYEAFRSRKRGMIEDTVMLALLAGFMREYHDVRIRLDSAKDILTLSDEEAKLLLPMVTSAVKMDIPLDPAIALRLVANEDAARRSSSS